MDRQHTYSKNQQEESRREPPKAQKQLPISTVPNSIQPKRKDDNDVETISLEQQSSNTLNKQQSTLQRIDEARKLFGELINIELEEKDKLINKVGQYDVLAKEFQKIISYKSRAKTTYYVDDDRSDWMKRFIQAIKKYTQQNEISIKRKKDAEEAETSSKRSKEKDTHGQEDLTIKQNEIPKYWKVAPKYKPEFPILLNKVADSHASLRKQVDDLIFENPQKLGKTMSITHAYRGIKVTFENNNNREEFVTELKKIDPEIEIKMLKFENPKIKVSHIKWLQSFPANTDEMNKLKEKLKRNIELANDIRDKTQLEVTHIFKQGPTDKIGIIIQLTPYLRSLFQSKGGKIYVGTGLYEFADCFDLKICYKCKRLGHLSGTCRSTIRCQFCSKPHTEQCQFENDEKYWICSTCGEQGHKFNTMKCAAFQKELIKAMRRFNYPYDWIITHSDEKKRDFD